MTRKHFKLIADALKASKADARVIGAMADALATTNPRFNRQRFIEAATYVQPTGTTGTNGNGRAEVSKWFADSEHHAAYVALYAKAA